MDRWNIKLGIVACIASAYLLCGCSNSHEIFMVELLDDYNYPTDTLYSYSEVSIDRLNGIVRFTDSVNNKVTLVNSKVRVTQKEGLDSL
jgi:hypothetical protein